LLAEVSDLDQQNTARLDKYFASLLKDEKNKEYRDRIYYQQARLAYRQKKYAEALALLQPAAKVPSPSKYQKGYTYLLAGRIYYENLQRYPLAAAYYDSAATAMPKDNPLYASVKERADILKEFAKQYTIIQTQDSLQALAKLPADELDKRLNTYAAATLEAKRQAEAKALAAQQALARQQAAAVNNLSNSPAGFTGSAPAFTGDQRTAANPGTTDPLNAVASGALWYFDNPTSLATARAEFIRRWGDRRLQDNWRTLNTPSSSPNDPANGGAPVSVTGNDQTRVNGSTGQPGGAAAPPDPLAEQKALATQYRQALPDTPAKLEASNQQIEGAMYELGGIYKELLKENQRGYDTYAGEVQRYPRGAHAPDADYLLYLYYKGLPDPAKAAQYAAALQEYFPTSTYAKLIADPQYREHERALHNAVAAQLDKAFELYKEQSFAKAKTLVGEIEQKYPKSDLTDRVGYLKLLLAVRTLPPGKARLSVQEFIKAFPDSPLVAQAQALGATYQKADAGQLAGAMASTEKPGTSQFRPGEVENRMRIVYGADESPYIDVPAGTTPATANPSATPAPAATPATLSSDAPAAAAPVPAATTTATEPATTTAKPNRSRKSKPQPGTAPLATTTPAPSAAPAAGATAPTTTMPSPGTATPAAGAATTPATNMPTAPGATPATAPEAAAPAVAYTTQLSAAHAVALVYPKGQAPVPDLAAALTTYDNKFFKAANLQVQPAQDLGNGQEMVVVRALPGSKVAQSYATKLRGPQSPLARLRGQGYQTVVISLANLALLQQSGGNVAGYQQFYQQVYQ
jgi:outer membrane protein assembly factor BamD (BamD/ComL family)